MTITRVRITSSWALLCPDGYPDSVWEGDVPVNIETTPGGDPPDPELVNEYLFRYFNRVDQADVDRLEDVGYALPSLSVGDLLAWDGHTWRVALVGFEKVT